MAPRGSRLALTSALGLLAAPLVMVTLSAAPAQASAAPPAESWSPSLSGGPAGQPCGGTVLCVGAGGDYATIGAAVAAAANGDTIQVQAGIYPERLSFTTSLTIRGGFASGSWSTRDPLANPTTIDAQKGGRVLEAVGPYDGSGSVVIDGMRLVNGKAPANEYHEANGSGLYIDGMGSVVISHDIFEGNGDGFAFGGPNESEGGAIAIDNASSVRVTDSILRNNQAQRGGAIATAAATLVVSHNLIEKNNGWGDHGGALYLGGADTTIEGNLVRGNRIGVKAGYGWGGGGIFFGTYGHNPINHATLRNNTWVENTAPGYGNGFFIDEGSSADIVGDLYARNGCGDRGGSGLAVDGGGGDPSYGSDVTLTNVTITAASGCASDYFGSGLYVEGGSSVQIKNSIITGNGGRNQVSVCNPTTLSKMNCNDGGNTHPRTSTVSYSLIGSSLGLSGTNGVSSAAPTFVNAANGDYRLAAGSAGIDAGDPADSVGDEPAPNGGRIDAGAYGGTSGASGGGSGTDPTASPSTSTSATATPTGSPTSSPTGGETAGPGLPTGQSDVWNGSCDSPATGTVYDVGPGRSYTSIGAVPWLKLGPGDRVNIYARSTPYREKILVVGQGTANAPITICGVAASDGSPPVIDGAKATTRAGMRSDFADTQNRGVITLAGPDDKPYGTKPSYVVIDGLEVTGAYPDNIFTNYAGATVTYPRNAAGIFVERGSYITVRDCLIQGNANGLFVASSGDTATDTTGVSDHLLIEGNTFRNDGVDGDDHEHSSYVAADQVVYQFNHYDTPRAGAQGSDLKDRSAGTVARYNWFNGNGRALDLVDAEDSPYLVAQPSYRTTWVYGNVIAVENQDPVSRFVHYGGDSGDTDGYRKGHLYFFNNTVVVRENQEGASPEGPNYSMQVFTLDTTDEVAEAWNNAISVQSWTAGQPAPEFYLYRGSGTYHLGANVVSEAMNLTGNPGDADGSVDGAAGVTKSPIVGLGVADVASGDYRPEATSPLVDAGGAAPVAVPAVHALAYQYHHDALGDLRSVHGSSSDVGAFESGAVEGIPGGTGTGTGTGGGTDGSTTQTPARPAVRGKPKVGRTLVGAASTPPSGYRVGYRWLRGSKVIAKGKRSHRVVKADRGKTLRFVVVWTAPDGTVTARASAPIRVRR